jgi:3-hydroxyisobutyrate dehydrogenase-like beta-hydroxyacid dehydrogenase
MRVQGSNERIGFIGVGLMGHGMAKNIVEKGYSLTVMGHRNRQPVEDLIGRGAKEATSPRAVAEASDIVFLCVTGSREVEAVVLGDNGLASGLKPGSIIIDASTSDPNSTIALAAQLAPKGITYVDAPLSRTPKEAWEGTLDTMVGCMPEVFARLKPVLDTWAGRVVHIGGTGDGHRMKLLNNFISMGYAAIYAEALSLAQKVGITPDRFDSVIRGGRMDCGFYQTFMKYTLERDRNAHKFTLQNASKDMRYLEAMADAAGMANPMGNAVKNIFAIAVATGRADDYVPMLGDIVAELNGTSLGPKSS